MERLRCTPGLRLSDFGTAAATASSGRSVKAMSDVLGRNFGGTSNTVSLSARPEAIGTNAHELPMARRNGRNDEELKNRAI
jgi:nicotinic acid phosphoribosyltransferase